MAPSTASPNKPGAMRYVLIFGATCFVKQLLRPKLLVLPTTSCNFQTHVVETARVDDIPKSCLMLQGWWQSWNMDKRRETCSDCQRGRLFGLVVHSDHRETRCWRCTES
eukprot:4164452-Amphidinium_carterae.1